ncbi:MAG: hypothetical protein CXT73_00795 [Methanobacteriota archaeon]|jgi:hypothetical protein|nr:MAG: hypothetical protein CXT73_00795 [Euryarchaeota archaeon]
MLIEEIIPEEKLTEFWPVLARIGMGLGGAALRGAKGLGRGAAGLGRGAKGLGRGILRRPKTTIGLGLGAHALASLFSKDPEAKKMHDEMEATEDEQERERLRQDLEARIKHWEGDMDILFPTWRDPVEEGDSPHPKGSKKYKAHMAAMHANM